MKRIKKKTTTNKSSFKPKAKNSNTFLKKELRGIFLLTLGGLTLVSLFTERAGAVGEYLRLGIEALMGEGSFLLPLSLFVSSIRDLFLNKERIASKSLYGFLGLAIILLTYLHLDIPKDSYFSLGKEGYGGGLLGGLLLFVLNKLFGSLGTYIILFSGTVAAVVVITNSSLAGMTKLGIKGINKGAKRVKEDLTNFIYDVVDEDSDEDLDEPKSGQELRTVNEKSDRDAEVEETGLTLTIGRDKKVVSLFPEAWTERDVIVEGNVENLGNDKTLRSKNQSDDNHDLSTSNDSLKLLPPMTLLNKNFSLRSERMNKDITARVHLLEETLANFGIKAKVTEVACGPAITRYEIQPAPGIKVSRIVNLADDLALSMAASDVRIEAPIPGKAAVGIEVPNREVASVGLREVLENDSFTKTPSKLAVALGKDIAGNSVVADLTKMPHLLIAGSTGSGKSVCMNALISSILFKATSDEVKFLMIDPKMVELTTYNGIPHLIAPVVTDPKKAAAALKWAVTEMENRYSLFAEAGSKNITGYNQKQKEIGEKELPLVVVLIDELADLMMVAPGEVEDAICRLAQMARAAGIHLVVATQRPSVDVITGLIKANIPSRIAFAVSSQVDSRTILDMAGAEKLLGKGDMLYFPVGLSKPLRVQGVFVSDDEVEGLVGYLKKQGTPEYLEGITKVEEVAVSSEPEDVDDLLEDAVRLVIDSGQASISMLQRRFRIGYTRAARLMDMMEEKGYVGGYEGSKPREVIISLDQWERIFKKNE